LKCFHSGHFHEVGEDTEIRRGAWNVEFRGQGNRLARVRNFGLHEAIEALLDRICDPLQTRSAFAYADPSPFSTQSAPSGGYRLIDLHFGCFRDPRDHLPVRRIHIVELLLPGHEAAIDVILD
jgi:hypothetical protein